MVRLCVCSTWRGHCYARISKNIQKSSASQICQCISGTLCFTVPGASLKNLKKYIYFRQTPLHMAVLNNHEVAVLAFLDHKKAIEKGDMPATDKSNVSLLPNLNLKNSEGDTPVSLALTEGKQKIYYTCHYSKTFSWGSTASG